MPTFNDKEITDKLRVAVEGLSNRDSYNSVCHEHRLGEPSVSVDKMGAIVNKIREILFPGYFGNTTLDPVAINYYMGVYADELFDMLSDQILAGLCFTCSERKEKNIDLMDKLHCARTIAADFISTLPEMRRKLAGDVEAAFLGDPAAQGRGIWRRIWC